MPGNELVRTLEDLGMVSEDLEKWNKYLANLDTVANKFSGGNVLTIDRINADYGFPFQLVKQEVVTTATAAASYTFKIPPEGKHCLITSSSWVNTSTDNVALLLRINGDTGNNYEWQFLRAIEAAVDSGWTTNSAYISAGYCANADFAASTLPAEIMFMSHYNSSRHKAILHLSGAPTDAAGSFPNVIVQYSAWKDTAPIRTITFYNSATANFGDGTIFSIYTLD